MEDFLGIRGLEGNLECGVGFIIIPENVDIEQYKKDAYQSGRISINGGYGHSNFYNILVDREVLQRIKFPDKSGKMGTPVVWLNIPKHNEPIVIACLKYDEDYFSLSENRRRMTVTHKGNMVDVDLDAKNGKIKISGHGKNKRMTMDIDLADTDGDAVFKINVDGEILMRALKRIVLIGQNSLEMAVTDKPGVVKARIKMSPNEDEDQFEYKDANNNSLSINKDRIELRADNSSKINLGSGKEAVVLGNTLLSIMQRLDNADAQATYPTPFGPTGTRLNQASYTAIRADFQTFLSKLSNTD